MAQYGNVSGRFGYPVDPREMLMQQQQEQKIKYEPSRSLRDLITERIVNQQECLENEQKRLELLIAQSGEAERASKQGDKGPGDQQISAVRVKRATEVAATGHQAYGAFGMPIPPFHSNDESFLTALGVAPAKQGNKKASKTKHPMMRYKQLQAEIVALTYLYRPSGQALQKFQAAMFPHADRNAIVNILLAVQESEEDSDDETGSEEEEQQEGGFGEFAPPQGVPRRARAPPGPRDAPPAQQRQPPQMDGPGPRGYMPQPNPGNAPAPQQTQPPQIGGHMQQQPMAPPYP
ncbi:hypothetical protein B0A55_05209 [Friedmanniomyces simplex]|uniref:Uncharacterized protein n=1 Tax=Friedmanniomyces simplex TaxID=329884 RepID=A0A4U0XEG8_9PEZI|nr:hypothetical protein B0A55_05209 [Friedmanniomyces simplex]